MPESRKIIRNVYILPCDGNGTGGIGTVTIRNDRITSVSYGRAREEVPAADVEVIDGTGKILLPGFIDLHMHGESMLLDLLTAGEPQSRWNRVPEYVKAEAYWYQHATRDDWSRLYTTVCYQALRSGVTFLGEFGVPTGDGACGAAVDAFARTEMPGMLTLHNADHLELAQRAVDSSLLFHIALPPAEELTTYNLQASLRMSRESGYPMVLHMSDADRDLDALFRNFGKGALQVMEEFGMLEAGCLVVHMHVKDQKDLQRLKQGSVMPILSPGGTLRKGLTFPPLSMYRQHDISTAVCTDWGPFSHWSVLRSMMERDMAEKHQAPSPIEYLRQLTVHPAAAIGKSHEIGSIVAGKRADLQMVRCRGLDLQAALEIRSPDEIVQAMIQRVTTSDVSDVMVRGEFSIREGTVLTYSEEDIIQDIKELLTAPSNPLPGTTDTGETPTPPEIREFSDADLGEEGFRIVRRTEDETPKATILPLDLNRDSNKEPTKTIRRVFGEDDL